MKICVSCWLLSLTVLTVQSSALGADEVVSALDAQRVTRHGEWREDRFRYAATSHLRTEQDAAKLEFSFDGTAVAVRLGGHNVPAYGPPSLGLLQVSIDGSDAKALSPRELPREVLLAGGLKNGRHTVRIEHLQANGSGCRIESFRTWTQPRGDVRFTLNGEANAYLVDARAILRDGDKIVRDSLVRNWMTGGCALTGLPPSKDYALEVVASGWRTARVELLEIVAGQETKLPPIYMRRDDATVIRRFRFPAMNRPATRRPGESFRARFLGFNSTIDQVRLTRSVGPATISRVLTFKEDESAAYYYDREVVAELPTDMPPGVYDLEVQITGGRRTGLCRSPRSVHVIQDYPTTDPVLVTFGHLDTSAQYQAEYLKRLATMINIIAPDMVLCSTACNPAYISGAFSGLEMPYGITFGNHQFPGHESWFGDPVGRIDLGPDISVLNFGHPWHVGTQKAEALLAARPKARLKIINAFESNAPIQFLDRHGIRMIHDAHGIGKKVMNLGATPTRRVGKTNAVSFRVVRFQNNRVDLCTYDGHETAPIPFARDEMPPLRVNFSSANDGTSTSNTATITNNYRQAFPLGRITFLLKSGEYRAEGGSIESRITSDNKEHCILTVRVDIPASGTVDVRVKKVEP